MRARTLFICLAIFWPTNTSCLPFLLLPAIYPSNHRAASLTTRTGGIRNTRQSQPLQRPTRSCYSNPNCDSEYEPVSEIINVRFVITWSQKSPCICWVPFQSSEFHFGDPAFYKTLSTSNKTQKKFLMKTKSQLPTLSVHTNRNALF